MDRLLKLEDLKNRLELSEEKDFIFKWKDKTSTRKHDAFNSRFAGKLAGGKRDDGYIQISIEGFGAFYAHRLAYMYYHNIDCISKVPEIIDHIDRDTENNPKGNLRPHTSYETNQRNRKSIGKSSYKGVDLQKSNGNYRSRIVINNKEVHLISSPSEKICASYYKAANEYMGYAPLERHYDSIPDITLPERVIAKIENAKRNKYKTLKSEYLGIGWNKKQNKWNAVVITKQGNICVGSFDCDYEAAVERDKFILTNSLSAPLSLEN